MNYCGIRFVGITKIEGDIMDMIIYCSMFAYGICFGSFFNVLVYRIPLILNGFKITTFNESSKCPKCSTKIKFYFNIPVIGWFLLSGKCYDCKSKIDFKYPLFEFCWGVVFVSLYFMTNNVMRSIFYFLLIFLLITLLHVIFNYKQLKNKKS